MVIESVRGPINNNNTDPKPPGHLPQECSKEGLREWGKAEARNVNGWVALIRE